MNPLLELSRAGQSVWIDYIRRSLLEGGGLRRLVEEDGVAGVTSNPTIFEKAIAGSPDYDAQLREVLAARPGIDNDSLFEALALDDIRAACAILRPVFDRTVGADGYVSFEVPASVANDTEATVGHARRLWKAIGRPNLMIKVPATAAGIPAIETLIAEGINVNITLMFSLDHYEQVAYAYIRGLRSCSDPSRVASVASFFVSRVDTVVDKALERIGTPEALALRGKAAVANSRLVYQRFREIFHGEPFGALRARGGRVQRPLWASTSTKNPAYRDVIYVEELVAPETVNTMPPATVDAFRDHGYVRGATAAEDPEAARALLAALARLGIDLGHVTDTLQLEGVAVVRAFLRRPDRLPPDQARAVAPRARARADPRAGANAAGRGRAPCALAAARTWHGGSGRGTTPSGRPCPCRNCRTAWAGSRCRRAWAPRPGRFGRSPKRFARQASRHVVLLGMGGSSLAPEVFQATFGRREGYPELLVADSTHPGAVRAVDDRIDLARTLFVVSSKSGTTSETKSFFRVTSGPGPRPSDRRGPSSSPSPTRARRWSGWRGNAGSAACSAPRPTSAAATRR